MTAAADNVSNESNDTVPIIDVIWSVLNGSRPNENTECPDQNGLNVKKLRRQVLLSLQLDESDKTTKKTFKRAVKALEKAGDLKLDEAGIITVCQSRKKRKSKGEKKSSDKKKRRVINEAADQVDDSLKEADSEAQDIQSTSERNVPCKGNPQGVTRLFLGNLPFAVDESSLGAFLPPTITHIKWITDKETGKFYGSAFIEMDCSQSAAEAVTRSGSQLMGRPIKINFAPSRPGDIWPPEKKVVTGASASHHSNTTGGQAGGKGVQAMSAKPDNCVKLFIGNLSYEIDDDGIHKFFANVNAEVKAVRWLHHKESGDFKGCGFVEFWNTEACEKAATLNGKNLLGRPIRIDWTD